MKERNSDETSGQCWAKHLVTTLGSRLESKSDSITLATACAINDRAITSTVHEQTSVSEMVTFAETTTIW